MNSFAQKIMALFKGSQAADLLPQNTPAPSTATRNNHFFALPLELRTIIYEYYFSYEHPRTPGLSPPRQIKSPHETDPTEKRKFQSILARKLPLLWSNKAILHEALPVLYRCHTFRVHVPYNKRYEGWERKGWFYGRPSRFCKRTSPSRLEEIETLKPVGYLITKIEIIEMATVFRGDWDESCIPGLGSLFHDFPNLRVLRLNVGIAHGSWYSDWPGKGRVLKEIWEGGLECLEVCLKHVGDEEKLFRETIAPASCWEKRMPVLNLGRGWLMVSVWVLRRSKLPKRCLDQLDGVTDKVV